MSGIEIFPSIYNVGMWDTLTLIYAINKRIPIQHLQHKKWYSWCFVFVFEGFFPQYFIKCLKTKDIILERKLCKFFWWPQSTVYIYIYVYIGFPMVCDVIWFLSNELCVFYPRALIFIQRVVCFLSPSLDFYPTSCVFSILEPWLGDRKHTKSYHITNHGGFFLSHIDHPIPVFVAFYSSKGVAYTQCAQCDIKNLSHECYHMSVITWVLSHWYQGKYVINITGHSWTRYIFLYVEQYFADILFLCCRALLRAQGADESQ
jgi:hypothetical protein